MYYCIKPVYMTKRLCHQLPVLLLGLCLLLFAGSCNNETESTKTDTELKAPVSTEPMQPAATMPADTGMTPAVKDTADTRPVAPSL